MARKCAWPAGLLFVMLVGLDVLQPVLRSAYLSDDAWGAQFPIAAEQTGTSMLQAWWATVQGWMNAQGRLFPVTLFMMHFAYVVFDSLAAYKAYQLAMLLGTLLVFVWFAWRITGSRVLAVLVASAAVGCMHMHAWVDAMLSFAGQQQLLVMLLFASVMGLLAYLRSLRWWWLAAGTVAWTVSLLTYEVNLLLFPILVLGSLLVPVGSRRRVVALCAYALPTLLVGAAVAILRANAPRAFDPKYTSNLELGPVLRTTGIQLYGVLPDSQHRLAMYRDIGDALDASGLAGHPLRIGFFALQVGVLAWCFTRLPRMDGRTTWVVFSTAALLLLVPAVVIAQVKHWQDHLQLGMPYIPVYMEYFGLALMVGVVLTLLRQLLRRAPWALEAGAVWTFGVLVGGFIGLTTQVAAQANDETVAGLNVLQRPLVAFDQSTKAGLFSRLQPNSVVTSRESLAEPIYNSCFIENGGGPHIRLVREPLPLPVPPTGCAQPFGSVPATLRPGYAVSFIGLSPDGLATVVLIRLDANAWKTLDSDGTTGSETRFSELRMFVRDSELAEDHTRQPRLRCISDPGGPMQSARSHVTERRRDWLLADVVLDGEQCLVDSIRLDLVRADRGN